MHLKGHRILPIPTICKKRTQEEHKKLAQPFNGMRSSLRNFAHIKKKKRTQNQTAIRMRMDLTFYNLATELIA